MHVCLLLLFFQKPPLLLLFKGKKQKLSHLNFKNKKKANL